MPWKIHPLGIDIGKAVFNVVGLSPQGDIVVRKKFSRKQLLHFSPATDAKRHPDSINARSPERATDTCAFPLILTYIEVANPDGQPTQEQRCFRVSKTRPGSTEAAC